LVKRKSGALNPSGIGIVSVNAIGQNINPNLIVAMY
jgi:hypothetical protein